MRAHINVIELLPKSTCTKNRLPPGHNVPLFPAEAPFAFKSWRKKKINLIHLHKSKAIYMLSISIYSYLPNVRSPFYRYKYAYHVKTVCWIFSYKLCMCLPDSVVSFCFSLLCSGPFHVAPPTYAYHIFQKSNFHRTCQHCGIPSNIFDTFIWGLTKEWHLIEYAPY